MNAKQRRTKRRALFRLASDGYTVFASDRSEWTGKSADEIVAEIRRLVADIRPEPIWDFAYLAWPKHRPLVPLFLDGI